MFNDTRGEKCDSMQQQIGRGQSIFALSSLLLIVGFFAAADIFNAEGLRPLYAQSALPLVTAAVVAVGALFFTQLHDPDHIALLFIGTFFTLLVLVGSGLLVLFLPLLHGFIVGMTRIPIFVILGLMLLVSGWLRLMTDPRWQRERVFITLSTLSLMYLTVFIIGQSATLGDYRHVSIARTETHLYHLVAQPQEAQTDYRVYECTPQGVDCEIVYEMRSDTSLTPDPIVDVRSYNTRVEFRVDDVSIVHRLS